jgi:hypothetical protein
MKKTPTIRKATVEELNAIVNRPDVIENLGGTLGHVEDIRTIDRWDRMLPLTAGDGAMLFLEVQPGLWRTDLLFIPHHRTNMEHARLLMTHVFEELGADTIFGLTPWQNKIANKFVAKLPGHWNGVSDDRRYNVYVMRRPDWPWLTKGEQNPN